MESEVELRSFDPATFNKTVKIDGGFTQLMMGIDKANIHLPSKPLVVSGMDDLGYQPINSTVRSIESDCNYKLLDLRNGNKIVSDKSTLISAYDESIAYYVSLEGKVAYVSHSLVTMYDDQYYPLNQLNLLFCTKSALISDRIKGSILADRWDVDTTINVKIAEQKRDFIESNVCRNSILLIDGPYLAGDGSFTFNEAIKRMMKNDIFPVFIVKNSRSTMIVDNFDELAGMYNSDLHYANEILKQGSRTPFFMYSDASSKDKSKVFCYLKHRDNYSPIRIEIPSEIYYKRQESVDAILDLIYYLIMVQGSNVNPQPRPIAVAEMYARETLNLIDINHDSFHMKLTATMNERRGME